MASTNVRPNAHLPPLKIDTGCITRDIGKAHIQYPRGVAAVEAYQKQAMNMTEDEQIEYKELLTSRAYFITGSAIGKSSNHSQFKKCRHQPCWPVFVLLSSMYDDIRSLHKWIGSLGNLQIDDFTKDCKDHFKRRKRVNALAYTFEPASTTPEPASPTLPVSTSATSTLATPSSQSTLPKYAPPRFLGGRLRLLRLVYYQTQHHSPINHF